MIIRPTEESWDGLDEILNNKEIASEKILILLIVVFIIEFSVLQLVLGDKIRFSIFRNNYFKIRI